MLCENSAAMNSRVDAKIIIAILFFTGTCLAEDNHKTRFYKENNAALIKLLNKERKQANLKPLGSNAKLDVAAHSQTEWMAQVGKMEHLRGKQPSSLEDFSGCDWHPLNRVVNAGYLEFASIFTPINGGQACEIKNTKLVGENIAHGNPNSGAENIRVIVLGWMNSKGHRDAILDQHFKDVGVGYTKTSDGHVWWCTVFGCKLLDDQKTER